MSTFSVIIFGIICFFGVLDIIGFVLFPFVIFCSLVLIKRWKRKQASKKVVDLTEVICTEPIKSISTSTRPTIPFYCSTPTSTCPKPSYCSIPLYNSSTSTVPSPISPIHSFHSINYTSSTLPTSPMSTFSCSSSSTLPLPPFLNKSFPLHGFQPVLILLQHTTLHTVHHEHTTLSPHRRCERTLHSMALVH